MASRPPSLTKKPHHAEPLRFETRLRIYSAVLCGIILILLTVLLIIEHFSATTILSILTIVIVAMLGTMPPGLHEATTGPLSAPGAVHVH